MHFLLRWLPVLAFLGATSLQAAWTDRHTGQPVIRTFPARTIGSDNDIWILTQDNSGQLLAGARELHSFDGAKWSLHSQLGGDLMRALKVASDGKIWVGRVNDVGFFVHHANGSYAYTSLLEKLPPGERDFGEVWACQEIAGKIYFSCARRLLCWDGEKFQHWDFPTSAKRVFPLLLEDELWLHHIETGLYRVTAQGPKLEFPPIDLPPRGCMWIGRENNNLLLASNDGIVRVGHPQEPINSPDVTEYLTQNRIICVQPIDEGYLIGTVFGGLLIVDHQWRLIRTVTTSDGLPGDAIYSLYLDRDKIIWGTTANGVFNFDSSGAVSQFSENPNKFYTSEFGQFGDDIYALTTEGIKRLNPEQTRPGRFESIEDLKSGYIFIAPFDHGLLLTRFGSIDFWDGRKKSEFFAKAGGAFAAPFASKIHPDRIYFIDDHDLCMLEKNEKPGWVRTKLTAINSDSRGRLHEDNAGNIWISGSVNAVSHFDSKTQSVRAIPFAIDHEFQTAQSRVVGSKSRVLCFLNGKLFAVATDTLQVSPVSFFPRYEAIETAVSTDRTRVFVLFKKTLPEGNFFHGLGSLELDENWQPLAWREYRVPEIITTGVPYALFCANENGRDSLWVGGSENILRINPDQLPFMKPPHRPNVFLTNLSKNSEKSSTDALPFRDHHLRFTAATDEISRRRQLRFQIRLGSDNTAWSEPTDQNAFEFTNLSDGHYEYQIRVVDDAGIASEPVSGKFRILPPAYRSAWAYALYGLAFVAGSAAFARFRIRRAVARTRELETQVATRTAELVEANAAKDEFLASMSHEIRNPLNGVVGLADTFDGTAMNEAEQRRLTHLKHCAHHLSGLLEDILDFSKIQADAITLDLRPFDLPELIESVHAITSTASARKGIPVTTAISPVVPKHVVGDAARIRQILLNFVQNALHYSDQGEVQITVWLGHDEAKRPEIIFSISDDGPGISDEEQQRIFSRFERGAAAKTNRVSGAGLGLSLCRKLAEKMNGRVWLESKLGSGSTFHFALPLEIAAAAPNAPVSEAALENFWALVVDDEEYNRLALGAMLTGLGVSSLTAANREKALEALSMQKFDAVFMDLDLPGDKGWEIARALRASGNLNPNTPIIATTGYSTTEQRQLCTEAGMNAFLTKPLSVEKIRAALRSTAITSDTRAELDEFPRDPLAQLKLLATTKGVTLQTEVTSFLEELAQDLRVLEESINASRALPSAQAAHRITGRFAFVHHHAASLIARDLESAAAIENWSDAAPLLAEIKKHAAELHDKLSAEA